MKVRYFIYVTTVMLINTLLCIFVMTFNSTYVKSSEQWLDGVKLALIIDYFGIKLGIPLIKTMIRQMIKWTKLSFFVMIYKAWVYIMALMKPKRVLY